MPIIIHNKEEFYNLVVTKHAQGWSIRYLSRYFKIGRNTVRRLLRRQKANRDKGHNILPVKKNIPRASKLDPSAPTIKKLLDKFPNITAQRVYEEIRDEDYKGGITIVRDYLRKIRPLPKREPIVRFETSPGEQGQMDWSPYTIPLKQGGKLKVLCFSYILGYSRRQYIHFTLNRNFYTLIRRHQDTFQYFQGVPMQCLYDNEKTVVLRWEAGSPVFNPAFTAFITHYNCRPIACKPRRPQTKGKVEAPFQYVENNFLNARDFEGLDDLNARARWWLKEISDPHIHDTTGRPPMELFTEQEQSVLQPLPLHPYDCSEVALRICRLDGFVELDSNIYSVPYEYIADILTLKATEYEVFVYSADLKLICRHERLPIGAGEKKETPEHRGSKKVRYGLEPVREAFLQLGNATQEFLKGLKEKHPRNCGFHARYILRLKEQYHCDDINKALLHAVKYQAFDSKSIERILKARAKPRTLESIRNQRAGEQLKKTLPKIQQRPLEEYASLFTKEEKEDE